MDTPRTPALRTTDSRPLAGQHLVVTGSTSGIGATTARLLAARGARVVVTGRDATRGEAVVADVVAAGGAATFVPGDVSAPPDALRDLARRWTEALDGRVDGVVHNAAVCPPVDSLTLSDEDLEAVLAVNVRAPHVLTTALVPAMCERGTGSVVVIGSWMASVGSPIVGAYSATKAAEVQLARSWAAEFGPRGVRVNVVSPGVTRTPINEDTGDVVQALGASTPARRVGTPEDVAAAVAWVLSPDAGYLHGAVLPVDGGISATRPA